MNFLSFYNLSRPYFALAFSWRFIAVMLLLLVAAGWYSLTQYSGLSWLNLNLASLPLSVYALWLLAIILSALFAWGCSPVERKLAIATPEGYIFISVKFSLKRFLINILKAKH